MGLKLRKKAGNYLLKKHVDILKKCRPIILLMDIITFIYIMLSASRVATFSYISTIIIKNTILFIYKTKIGEALFLCRPSSTKHLHSSYIIYIKCVKNIFIAYSSSVSSSFLLNLLTLFIKSCIPNL